MENRGVGIIGVVLHTDYIAGESIGEGANTTSELALLLQLLACRNMLLRQVCWTPPRATIPLQE